MSVDKRAERVQPHAAGAERPISRERRAAQSPIHVGGVGTSFERRAVDEALALQDSDAVGFEQLSRELR